MNARDVITPERIGHYVFRGTLGSGSFSVVKLVAEVATNQLFACKVVPIENLSRTNSQSRFETEIRIIQQLRHPGIVQLYDLLKDEKNYYIIMELCTNGELFQYIVENQRLEELQARYFLRQILDGLKYVHNLGIVHRDIKPENLLISQDGHIKISDFGFSRFVNSLGLADTPCGSPCYASPECIRGGSYDGRKSDVWSVGVVAYAMVTGELPWTKKNQLQLLEQIGAGEYTVPSYVSEPCRDFIKCLMEPDPNRRVTVEGAASHKWIVGAPSNRICNGNGNSSRPALQISLKKLDRFFGRDPSESYIEGPIVFEEVVAGKCNCNGNCNCSCNRNCNCNCSSEDKQNVGLLMRSCSTMMTSIEDTVREISTKAVRGQERQTARAAAKNMLFPRKSLPIHGPKAIANMATNL